MVRTLAALALSTLTAAPALANDFAQVREKQEFLSLVNGKELRIGLYNLTLKVRPDGRIEGRALGWNISGSWDWKNGYFCRVMDWSGKEIPYNCQTVEARGGRELRFIADQGKGQAASFRLR